MHSIYVIIIFHLTSHVIISTCDNTHITLDHNQKKKNPKHIVEHNQDTFTNNRLEKMKS